MDEKVEVLEGDLDKLVTKVGIQQVRDVILHQQRIPEKNVVFFHFCIPSLGLVIGGEIERTSPKYSLGSEADESLRLLNTIPFLVTKWSSDLWL